MTFDFCLLVYRVLGHIYLGKILPDASLHLSHYPSHVTNVCLLHPQRKYGIELGSTSLTTPTTQEICQMLILSITLPLTAL